MYGGTTLPQQPGMGMGGPPGPGAAAASPIPQQWWEQERSSRGMGGGGGPNGNAPPPPPPGAGMSAMDAAVANNSYRGTSPSMSQRFHNLHMNNANMNVSLSAASPSNRAMGNAGGDYPPSPGGYNNHSYSQYSNHPHSSPGDPGQGQGPGQGPYGNRPMNMMNNTMNNNMSTSGPGMSTPNAMHSAPPPPGTPKGPSANGLIRITLKKPMGIVFEPMEDPHNPSQQRGVRVCDLPRTGAAALSGMLEVGDELLSINNKPMSRLTFDEIMDFIIDADAEHVDLLFRRPKKDKRTGLHDSGGASRGASSIKWKDVNVQAEVIVTDNDDGTVEDSPSRNDKNKGRYGSPGRRDEESIYSADDTFYTEQTSFTEETRKSTRRGKRRNRRYESESFLDMLIDTVCAPVMGTSDKRGDYSDDDMTFNSADDGTYASLDESYNTLEERKRKWQESKRKRREKERKSLEEERERDAQRKRDRERERERSRSSPERSPDRKRDRDRNRQSKESDFQSNPNMPPAMQDPYNHDDEVEYVDRQKPELLNVPIQNSDPSGFPPQSPNNRPRPNSKSPRHMAHNGHHPSSPVGPPTSPPRHQVDNSPMRNQPPASPSNNMNHSSRLKPSDRFEPQAMQQADENDESLEQDPNIPFKEIEYDDNVDGEVSVMESVGGPSLLLENLRNAAKVERTVSEDIVRNFGKDFKPQLGLTREETVQMNPDEFYRYVVKSMLEENEPEKVRLIDKLFAKYGGREEHLIRKLDARYVKPAQSNEIVEKQSEESEGGAAYEGFKAFGGNAEFSSGEDNEPDGFDGGNAWNNVPNFDDTRGGGGNRPSVGNVGGMNGGMNMGMPMNNNGFGQGGGGVVVNAPNQDFNNNGQFQQPNQNKDDEGSHSSYSEESDYGSVDGTSPEVIAQVSELLNYVYGKTTVAGQIDRVSTIMRAYEGREAVLLELLETKALLKANNEKGGLDGLPESLRDNPGLQPQNVEVNADDRHGMSPISNVTGPSGQASAISVHSAGNASAGQSVGQSVGQSTVGQSVGQPQSVGQQSVSMANSSSRTPQSGSNDSDNPFDLDNENPAPSHNQTTAYGKDKKKKKGLFGGMFKKKNKQGAFPTNDGGGKRKNKKGALLASER